MSRGQVDKLEVLESQLYKHCVSRGVSHETAAKAYVVGKRGGATSIAAWYAVNASELRQSGFNKDEVAELLPALNDLPTSAGKEYDISVGAANVSQSSSSESRACTAVSL